MCDLLCELPIETAPSSVTGLACAQFRYRGAWSPTHLRTLLQLTALLSNHSNQIVQHVYNIHNDGTIIDHPDIMGISGY
jgi:hypothetical protein